MTKKVVLVKPPERSALNFGTYSLAVLAAAIRHIADVSILDATSLSVNEAVEAIWSRQPDLIGVTVMALSSVQPAAVFIRQLRAAGQAIATGRVTIIAGGHGASMVPGTLLNSGAAAVVMGEGELTFQQMLAEGICPGAPGVACLSDSQPIIGPPQTLIDPLDRLMPPARDLMPPSAEGVHLMETSRGCPHACTFCEATRFFGRRWRPYSPERVAAEVRRLVEDYDAWIIHFADDNFAASPRRVLRICEALQNQTLPAFFMASARADDLFTDPNLLPALAAARILRVSVGVETLNLQTASRVGKPIGLETYRDVFRRMRELGIFSIASLIVGLPGEDPNARAQAVALAVEAGPDSAQFLPFLPLPGTPLGLGHSSSDPDPADVRDAHGLTQAFFQHPTVQASLQTAAREGGIRGLLAHATLEKRSFTA